ncbi:MAG: EamA family transporter [Acidobacteria bacterium]|nr:MAG: EamA family transporter [Acidobacteriota bacterium]
MPAIPAATLGQLAALGTAFCWAFSALAFAAAGRRMGVLPLNLIRLAMALGFLALATWALRGLPLPVDATPRAWGWLAVSGLIGFVFGDLCLFQAYVLIGPRIASLMMSFAPLLTALIGWLVLGETLTGRDALGVALTVAGISWAVLERREPADGVPHDPRSRAAGLALGFCGALGQAGGLVLSKLGMGSYDPIAATEVRVIAAIAGYALLLAVVRGWPRVAVAARDRRGLGFAATGAFFGPFLGVSLSLFAVRHTVAGVAASIMALQPVLIIPLVVILHRERVGVGGVAGALVAVAGVALLFL